MLAADKGCVEICRALLALGASPTARDSTWGNTPFHFAASSNSVDVLAALTERTDGAAKLSSTKNKHGDNPAMIAATTGSTAALSYLVRGASPDELAIANRSGDSVLLLAAQHAEEEMVRELLSLGADPTVTNSAGMDTAASATAMVKCVGG